MSVFSQWSPEGVGRDSNADTVVQSRVLRSRPLSEFRIPNSEFQIASPQTSSSSASSARSMMNRNRAEASRPINSLMIRSVTI